MPRKPKPPTAFIQINASSDLGKQTRFAGWREVASFFIPGIPRPGGSKTAKVIMRGGKVVTNANGRPLISVRDDAKGNADWKANVRFFAQQHYSGAPLDGLLKAEFTFYMPRTTAHYGTGKNAGKLKANAPVYHTVKPDATKLTRSTEDALSGSLWVDDARIGKQSAEKLYACEASGWKPGAMISVSVWDGEQGDNGAEVGALWR